MDSHHIINIFSPSIPSQWNKQMNGSNASGSYLKVSSDHEPNWTTVLHEPFKLGST